MCNQNKTVTLQNAVLLTVQEFAAANKTFSIHDITQTLREKTSNNELEIPETAVVGQSFNFEIRADKVKEIFLDLWQTGVFTPDFSLNRQYNGTYFEYTPTPVAPLVQSAPTTAIASSSPTVTATSPSVNRADKQTVSDKIEEYLENHRGQSVTVEKIRAAIKCNGWTCNEIQDIVANFVGSLLNRNPQHPSKSVATL
jgi:hypothetical protein